MYYYGARYYDPKVSLWLSVDPIALYDPIDEVEHYIDGEHNGGYYNPRNTSVYGYCYQNPIVLVDPNGKQALAGAILGVFTEYASIVGERMLFEDMSFSEANGEIGLKDVGKMTVAGGFGAISGVAKFAKWAGSSTGRKILIKMVELGIDGIEDVIKQYIDGDVDLKQTLVTQLTSLGMGWLLKGTKLEKLIKKQEDKIAKAEKEIQIIKSSGVGTVKGQAKKIRTQNAVIKTTEKKLTIAQNKSNVIKKISTAGAGTVSTGIYKKSTKKK